MSASLRSLLIPSIHNLKQKIENHFFTFSVSKKKRSQKVFFEFCHPKKSMRTHTQTNKQTNKQTDRQTNKQ